jgi:hypothetical protein
MKDRSDVEIESNPVDSDMVAEGSLVNMYSPEMLLCMILPLDLRPNRFPGRFVSL